MEKKREITFYNDTSHNYMVLECPQGFQDNYQYRMIAANQIRGLLPCSIRHIDDREYLYYDITSRQNLGDVYERRPVSGADLERILTGLVRMETVLTEYLLDVSHLLLDPACIYVDFREQECSFAYYPGEMQEMFTETSDGPKPSVCRGLFTCRELFAFLADHVDGRDKHAAGLIYRLCMMAEKPGFRLRAEILEEMGIACERKTSPQFFPGDAGAERFSAFGSEYEDGSPVDRGGFTVQNAGVPGYGGKPFRHGSCEWNDPVFEGSAFEEPMGTALSLETEQEQGTEQPSGIKGRRMLISGILLFCAGAAAFSLPLLIPLAERELILSRAMGGLTGASGLILLAVCLIRKLMKTTKAKDAEEPAPRRGEESIGNRESALQWDRENTGSRNRVPRQDGEDAGSRNRVPRQDGEDAGSRNRVPRWDAESVKSWKPGPWREEESLRGSPQGSRRIEDSPERRDPFSRWENCTSAGISRAAPAVLGETSLLGPDSGEAGSLYGVGACRGEQISLRELPCVVGKMREYVDQVLDDGSVSRMHAKFSEDRDGKMTVRDLNSTNGTWLNGERLQPNEIRTLQKGDHVRLGRMEFVFR